MGWRGGMPPGLHSACSCGSSPLLRQTRCMHGLEMRGPARPQAPQPLCWPALPEPRKPATRCTAPSSTAAPTSARSAHACPQFANSCQVDSLSLRHWDQDDPNEMLGAHTFLPGGCLIVQAAWAHGVGRCRRAPAGAARGGGLGRCPGRMPACTEWRPGPEAATPSCQCLCAGCNGRWVQELCRELPIFYGSRAREIRYCATGASFRLCTSSV